MLMLMDVTDFDLLGWPGHLRVTGSHRSHTRGERFAQYCVIVLVHEFYSISLDTTLSRAHPRSSQSWLLHRSLRRRSWTWQRLQVCALLLDIVVHCPGSLPLTTLYHVRYPSHSCSFFLRFRRKDDLYFQPHEEHWHGHGKRCQQGLCHACGCSHSCLIDPTLVFRPVPVHLSEMFIALAAQTSLCPTMTAVTSPRSLAALTESSSTHRARDLASLQRILESSPTRQRATSSAALPYRRSCCSMPLTLLMPPLQPAATLCTQPAA